MHLSELRSRFRSGFTLVELIAVLILIAIAATSAAPVMDTVDRSRKAGVRDEVVRRLMMARSHAMTTGMPSGVRFDVDAQMAEGLEIASSGAAPSAMKMQGHGEAVDSMFAGVAIESVVLDGGGSYDTVWFSNEGAPHYRTSGGVYVGAFTQDAVVTVSGGGTVTVRMVSGMIE